MGNRNEHTSYAPRRPPVNPPAPPGSPRPRPTTFRAAAIARSPQAITAALAASIRRLAWRLSRPGFPAGSRRRTACANAMRAIVQRGLWSAPDATARWNARTSCEPSAVAPAPSPRHSIACGRNSPRAMRVHQLRFPRAVRADHYPLAVEVREDRGQEQRPVHGLTAAWHQVPGVHGVQVERSDAVATGRARAGQASPMRRATIPPVRTPTPRKPLTATAVRLDRCQESTARPVAGVRQPRKAPNRPDRPTAARRESSASSRAAQFAAEDRRPIRLRPVRLKAAFARSIPMTTRTPRRPEIVATERFCGPDPLHSAPSFGRPRSLRAGHTAECDIFNGH